MKTIGRYIIRGLLGRGGMSKVYRVSLPVVGNMAALKLLDPHPSLVTLMGKEKIRDLFAAEAKTMAGLRHPNIVSIRDFDAADGKLFYVMEYFSNNLGDLIGETYRTESPSRILTIDKTIYYARQIIQGVARLHHDRIIHRDIKPFNLLITEQDTVKICDFGLSKLRGEASGSPANLKIGSPFYAAPEQEANPDKVGFESDIFSIGVVIYRLLTGKLPYDDSSSVPEPLSRLNPNLDSNWDDFIFSAISFPAKDRITDARTMALELDALARDWEAKKERMCRISEHTQGAPQEPPGTISQTVPTTRLRHQAVKVTRDKAREAFGTDALDRPMRYVQNRFEQPSSLLVKDRGTGLVWQQSGSPYPFTWTEARDYINHLNLMSFGNMGPWRLPTVAELTSLLTPAPQGDDFCTAPIFDTTQKWLWSTDRCTFTSAWHVNMELGFVGKNDFSALYYARAVCDGRRALP